MKPPRAKAERVCSICGVTHGDLTSYLDGHVCETCCENTREGRDGTTQALKLKQTADRLQVEQLQGQTGHQSAEAVEYTIAAGQLMAGELLGATTPVQIGSGGEVIKPAAAGMINTLSQPSIAALDASNHRTDLLTMLGSDIAAMALDAADTIEAGNSLEKMLAHQMISMVMTFDRILPGSGG
jgi:hypothetical protein